MNEQAIAERIAAKVTAKVTADQVKKVLSEVSESLEDASEALADLMNKRIREDIEAMIGGRERAQLQGLWNNAVKGIQLVRQITRGIRASDRRSASVDPADVGEADRAVHAIRDVVTTLMNMMVALKREDQIAPRMVDTSLRKLKDIRSYAKGLSGTLVDIRRALA